MIKKRSVFLSLLILTSLLLSACADVAEAEDIEPTETYIEEAPEEIIEVNAPIEEPFLEPADPPEPVRTLQDSDSSLRASENRTLGVDKFLDGLYERPFTAIDMIYQPDLDIISVDFAFDDEFFFFTIRMYGLDPEAWALTGSYGIEFDRSLTGRGDLFVLANGMDDSWSTEYVQVFIDSNGDIGGPQPMQSDINFQGSGYDTEASLEGEKVAFARLDPEDEKAVQIVISRSLLEDAERFLWGAWAIGDINSFGVDRFDLNDGISIEEAGSPFRDDKNYPIKDLYSLDNTCRLPYGFAQSGNYPGMCKIGTPPKPPSKGGGSKDSGGGGSSCPSSCPFGMILWDCECVWQN